MFTVNYADSGSRVQRSEEQTYIFFMDFLNECEGKNYVFTMYCITTMYVILLEEHGECTLEDIFSGARSIPPAGWPKKPTLQIPS